jgi:hypothetical protein
MTNKLSQFIAAVAIAASASGTHAAVLTFDDLAGTNFFTASYNGFRFGDLSIATNPWFWTNTPTVNYQPLSGTGFLATDFQLYTGASFEATQPIYNPTPFFFQGAWFSANADALFYRLYTGVQTTPGSLSGLTLVYTSALSPLLTVAPSFVSSGYAGAVTAVVIVGRQGYYAMDNFTYAPVPEPSTYGLMALGLLGVAAAARRKLG